MVYANGKVFFTGYDNPSGRELWVSDGTELGTYMVKDIHPGSESGIETFGGFLTVWDNKLVFQADDGVHGKELWISDGTAGGTRLLHDLEPGFAGSIPSTFTVFQNRLVYTAYQSATGLEPYYVSSHDAVPQLLADLNPGPDHSEPLSTSPFKTS